MDTFKNEETDELKMHKEINDIVSEHFVSEKEQTDAENICNINDKKDDSIINNLQSQIDLLQDKLLRSMADNENIRKRYEKRIEEAGQYSITKFAKDLLPIIDNFNLALKHKESDNFVSGVELTQQELLNIFKNNNIEEISPQIGEFFDYNIHNAISQIVTNEQPDSTILNVMQVGYKIKDRLLRAAQVVVAKNN